MEWQAKLLAGEVVHVGCISFVLVAGASKCSLTIDVASRPVTFEYRSVESAVKVAEQTARLVGGAI